MEGALSEPAAPAPQSTSSFFGGSAAAVAPGQPPFPNLTCGHVPRIVLHGSPGTGKTTLLFQYARDCAASGCRVVFICSRCVGGGRVVGSWVEGIGERQTDFLRAGVELLELPFPGG